MVKGRSMQDGEFTKKKQTWQNSVKLLRRSILVGAQAPLIAFFSSLEILGTTKTKWVTVLYYNMYVDLRAVLAGGMARLVGGVAWYLGGAFAALITFFPSLGTLGTTKKWVTALY